MTVFVVLFPDGGALIAAATPIVAKTQRNRLRVLMSACSFAPHTHDSGAHGVLADAGRLHLGIESGVLVRDVTGERTPRTVLCKGLRLLKAYSSRSSLDMRRRFCFDGEGRLAVALSFLALMELVEARSGEC